MGQALQPEVSLVALVFVLGLKHGLDPDHLVAIDGFTRTTRSRWCGLFFSLGHGLVVTLVGVAVAIAAAHWQAPGWLELSGAWISIAVLTVLGVANLLALARTPPGQPVGLIGARSHWLPARLAEASHPAVIAAVGAAFAVSFDTVSHALVFSAGAGAAFAALLGAVFTLGMASTDALNGWWISPPSLSSCSSTSQRAVRRSQRNGARAKQPAGARAIVLGRELDPPPHFLLR